MFERFIRLIPFAIVACGPIALAQDATRSPADPATSPIAPAPPPAASETPTARFVDPYMPNHEKPAPTTYTSPRRPPRTRTAPDPHDNSSGGGRSDDASDYGLRNPGGVGRRAEFYPPGNQFANGGKDPIGAATFGGGPAATNRNEQLQAQQVGIQKQNEFDNRINSLARPLGGFGAGFGFGYGFGGFPY